MTSIGRNGFLCPLFVWQCGDVWILIDGHHRYHIWEASYEDEPAKWPSIVEMKFDDRDDAKEWIIKHQLGRRNLVPAMRVKLELDLTALVMAKAKANLATSTGGADPQPLTKSAKVEPVNVRKHVAKNSKVSEDTVAKVERVLASGNESVTKAMLAGETKVNTAFNEVSPKPVKTWEVEDDIKRIRKLVDVLSDNWKTKTDRDALRKFFRTLGSEV